VAFGGSHTLPDSKDCQHELCSACHVRHFVISSWIFVFWAGISGLAITLPGERAAVCRAVGPCGG
jgi:hypothetical protein